MNVLKFSPRSILCRSNIAGFQTQSFFNTKIVIPKSFVTFSNPTIHFRRLYSVDPKSVDPMDDYELKIFTILNENLDPDQLTVTDVSGGCGSMFAINIISPKFKGITMVKQHRAVNELLAEEIKKWHGLQLVTKASK